MPNNPVSNGGGNMPMPQGMNNQPPQPDFQKISNENDPMAPHAMQSLLNNAGGGNFPSNPLQMQQSSGGMNRNSRDSPESPPEPQPSSSSFFKYPIPQSQRSSPSGDNHMSNGMNLPPRANGMMNGGGGGP